MLGGSKEILGILLTVEFATSHDCISDVSFQLQADYRLIFVLRL